MPASYKPQDGFLRGLFATAMHPVDLSALWGYVRVAQIMSLDAPRLYEEARMDDPSVPAFHDVVAWAQHLPTPHRPPAQ